MIETIVAIAMTITFALGMWAGYEAGKPTEQQEEIINKACEHIYENESLEVYTEYCK